MIKPKLLIADDEPSNVRMLGELLKNDYEIFVAGDGITALEIASGMRPDLVILDVIMPGMDGYAVAKELKKRKETADIPVIFVTARNRAEDIVQGFDAGGRDYIPKPFFPQELYARVKTHVELKQAQEKLRNDAVKFGEMNRKLADALERMETMARIDPLTGLANRRFLLERLEQETSRAKRKGHAIALAMADIDDFKSINDTHGHDCGDEVLRRVAFTMKECIRKEDVAARWGGEEFLLLFVDVPLEEARATVERMRESVAATKVEYHGASLSVTVTIGVSSYDVAAGQDANIRRADDAMYRGKKLTKNCVIVAD